jgi:peptidoglycan L-alanyl-D-glutamate endopeptidase CwlK
MKLPQLLRKYFLLTKTKKMAFKFGTKSRERIGTVNPILQELAYKTIEISPYDISITRTAALRTPEMQKELFDKGSSQLDGYKKKSFHQTGDAIDFVPYIDGGVTWKNKAAFLGIAKAAFKAWEAIDDKQGYHLHWGGYWRAEDLDGDGILEVDDKLGWDLPHFELRKYPQTKGKYPLEWA